MPVTCPHCSTRYVLPRALLGPGGARVRCPRCREPFSVSPDGEAIAPPAKPVESAFAAPAAEPNPANGTPAAVPETVSRIPAAHAPYAPPGTMPASEPEKQPEPVMAPEPVAVVASSEPAPGVIETPIMVARAVLDELAKHSDGAIAASRDAGKLFREFGPVIAEAFEFYRRQVGPGADAAPFRTALREKWGVDLDPGHPTGRLG